MNKKLISRLFIICLFIASIAIYSLSDLKNYFNLNSLKENQEFIMSFYEEDTIFFILLYCTAYILMVAFSVPGAAIMTLIGGLVFDTILGTIVVSFASTIGASINFLVSRYLFRDYLEKRLENKLKVINKGIEKDGILYLLSLRLVPIFPFFLINLAMGLTRVKLSSFFFISQIGMLPGTIIYVNAGSKLASLNSLSDVLSVSFILSVTALGLLPFLGKFIMTQIKKK